MQAGITKANHTDGVGRAYALYAVMLRGSEPLAIGKRLKSPACRRQLTKYARLATSTKIMHVIYYE